MALGKQTQQSESAFEYYPAEIAVDGSISIDIIGEGCARPGMLNQSSCIQHLFYYAKKSKRYRSIIIIDHAVNLKDCSIFIIPNPFPTDASDDINHCNCCVID